MLTEKLKVGRLTYIPNLAMPKSKIDKAREERIRNEIIVDCYNDLSDLAGGIPISKKSSSSPLVPFASPRLRLRH